MINSPIKWMGGKARLRKTILGMLPEHICYCEPFGGAGWVLFAKNHSEVEVYNDINGELVNFFKVVRDKPEEFIRAFDYLLISRELFQKFKALNVQRSSDVDRAVRFYYLVQFSFGALMKNFLITPLKRGPQTLKHLEEVIKVARMRLLDTIIENRDFEKVITSYDRASTCFYCDPPYYGLTDYKSQGSMVFSKDDHIRLRDTLASIHGKFLLSINDHPEIRMLYSGFYFTEVEVKYTVCKTDNTSRYPELIISNFKVPEEQVEKENVAA